MKIAVYCADKGDAAYQRTILGFVGEGVDVVFLSASRIGKPKGDLDFAYFDSAALSAAKLSGLGDKLGPDQNWGVLDKAGAVADPAALFHGGAADYLGPQLLKRGARPIVAERLRSALALARRSALGAEAIVEGTAASGAAMRSYPAFPGWGKLKVETCYPFEFVFAALGDQRALMSRFGEKGLDRIRADFSRYIEAWAEERGGKLWIRDASTNLLLFPATEEPVSPITDLLRLQLDRVLIGYEVFRVDIPLRFRFALHEGDAPWREPGNTGTVVSEHVNFIYHLGMKAIEDGRIGVSDAAFRLIPEGLASLFRDAPDFEDHRVRQSLTFT